MKRQKEIPGSIVKVQMEPETHIYGRVLNYGDMAFYDYRSMEDLSNLNIIVNAPIMFKAIVDVYCVKMGRWPIVGHLPLEESLQNSKYWSPEIGFPHLCKISENGIYRLMVDKSEAKGLFDGAIWPPESIEQRIRDFYLGIPNETVEWVKSLY